jgi:ferredoxin
LRKVTDALSLDEEGVKLGLWRWRFKFPRWLNVERRRACRDPLQCLWEKKEVPIKREDDFERVLGVLKTMYEVLEEDKRMATLISRGRKIASLVKRDTKIVVEAEDMDWVKILRGIARALLCVKCMLCLATCPNEAIKMGLSGVEILTEKCMACGECNYTCPIWAYSLKSPHIAKRLLD